MECAFGARGFVYKGQHFVPGFYEWSRWDRMHGGPRIGMKFEIVPLDEETPSDPIGTNSSAIPMGQPARRQRSLSDLMRGQPVGAGAVLDEDRHVAGQGQGGLHGIEDLRDEFSLFLGGEVEDEFVVDLEQHLRLVRRFP